MCTQAEKTAVAVLAAEEGELKNLLTFIGQANTPLGISVYTAYTTAVTALQNWVPGTAAAEASQIVTAFLNVFNQLPIPSEIQGLADLIGAAVQTVLGILEANSPAPAATGTVATPEAQELHAHAVEAKTEAAVQEKTGFKLGWMDKVRIAHGDHTIIKKRFDDEWNKKVPTDPKYAALKVAA